MMRKIFLFLVLVIGICGTSYGETIFEGPCAQGGNTTVDSSEFSYDEVSGNYFINFRVNDCIDDTGIKFNGTISSSGTFRFRNETTADVVINTDINGTGAMNGNTFNISNCSGKYEGVYDLSTESLNNGRMNLNCSVSGNMSMDIFNLLTGPKPEI